MKKGFIIIPGFLLFCLLILFQFGFSQSMNTLQLKSGNYQLTPNMEKIELTHLWSSKFQESYFVLVHFKVIPTTQQKNSLSDLGVSLRDYLPENSFLAELEANTNLDRLVEFGIDGIYWVRPEFKMSYQILQEDYPEHALNGDRLKMVVQNHPIEDLNMKSVFAEFQAVLIKSYSYSQLNTIEIPIHEIQNLAKLPFIKYMEIIAPDPVPEDLVGETNHRMNYISNSTTNAIPFNGTGVWLAVGDDGAMGPHIDYKGRMDLSSVGASTGTHGDHVAGIMMGAGNIDPDARGMAWGADIKVYDVWDAVNSTPISYFNPGVIVTSTSYGNGCNAGYTSFAQSADQQVRQMPNLMHVFSAGNSGTSNCGYGAGSGWGNITGGIKSGKNVLAVGNVTANNQLSSSSSRGPASDGRIKPDICANGTQVNSCFPDNQYTSSSGTSMAAPGVSGTYGALVQAYRVLNGGATPSSDLVKGAMLNTADDLGNPGPDFKFGWGRLNARKVLNVFENNTFMLDSIGQGGSNLHSILVPSGVDQVKIMVYWNDYEGAIQSSKALVNNLDMTVTSPVGSISFPFVLDPTPIASNLNTPATNGVDTLNNMEQIVLNAPIAGNYIIDISGTSVPQGIQKYYVIYEFITSDIIVTYPTGGEGFVPGTSEIIRWDASEGVQNFQIEYTLDSGLNWINMANVNGTSRQVTFSVPNVVTGNAKIRIIRSGISGESKMYFSIIGVPTDIEVISLCPNSFDLKWSSVPGATAYEVSVLGSKYMDSVITVMDTFATVIGFSAGIEHWVSVKAKTNDAIGKRAYAIQKQAGVWNCILNEDIGLELISPSSGVVPSCVSGKPRFVTVKLKNNGLSSVTNVGMNMQINNGAINNEIYYGIILPGDSVYFSFADDITLPVTEQRVDYSIWKDGMDDNPLNDSIIDHFSIRTSTSISLGYSTDFQDQITCSTASNCGLGICNLTDWINAENGVDDAIDFRTNRGGTVSGSTGPDAGHTTGSSTDKYVYLEASGSCEFMRADLLSPCFNLENTIQPEASIWYHMYGSEMGDLHFDVLVNAMWELDVIPSISGNQGTSWKKAIIDLSDYVGQNNIVIRFRAITGSGYRSDISLDDFEIKETMSGIFSDTTFCQGMAGNISSIGFSSGASYSWNFGANSNPSSSVTSGPHLVTYNTHGTKQITVDVIDNGITQSFTNTILVLESATVSFDTQHVADDQIQFINTTVGAIRSFWEFGDGGSSRQFNDAHTYAISGIYTVSLTSENACGSSMAIKDMYVGIVGVEDDLKGGNEISVYPNPSSGKIQVHVLVNSEVIGLDIFDMKGVQVFATNESPINNIWNLDLTYLSVGVYMVRVRTLFETINHKIVIE